VVLEENAVVVCNQCPGELNYSAIMRKLLELGYDGYVGQEFLTESDAEARAALADAVRRCDV
jgi:hydroxypyruvate isomerase